MPLAISYSRFSSAGQADGLSEARQAGGAELWCLRNGYDLDESLRFIDRGRSGFHGDHLKPGAALAELVALAKAGRFPAGTVLLVEDVDRLSRLKWREGVHLFGEIADAGVDIVTLTDNKRYTAEGIDDDMGTIYPLIANLTRSRGESSRKSGLSASNWAAKRVKARAGEVVTRRAPAWVDGTTREVIAEKADLVRRIYAMAAAGDGPTKIAMTLNAEGVPPLRAAAHWGVSVVQYLLKSPTVLGQYQPCKYVGGKAIPEGEPIRDYYPAIIDRELYDRVRRTLADRVRHPRRGRTSDCPNLFVGLVRSLFDGGPFHHKENAWKNPDGSTGRRAWLIPLRAKMAVPGAMNLAIGYLEFESAVLRFLKELDILSLFAPGERGQQARRLASLEAELADVAGRVAELRGAIKVAKPAAVATLAGLLAEVEAGGVTMEAEAEDLRQHLTSGDVRAFADLRKILDDVSARPRIAAALRSLIDRIEILPVVTGVGPHRKTKFLLYVEIVFRGGQRRIVVTDDAGTDRLSLVLHGKTLPPGATLPSDVGTTTLGLVGYSTTEAVETMRPAILADLIGRATPEWREKLQTWYSGKFLS